jgi:hypothetical protein
MSEARRQRQLSGRFPHLSTLNHGRAAYRDSAHAAVGAVQPSNAVLVVHSPAALSAGDKAVKAAMDIVFGAPFYTIQPDTWTGTVPDNGVIVIAGSANPANVGSHFTSSLSGVLVLNPNIYPAMNMVALPQGSHEGAATTNSLTNQLWYSTGYIDGTANSEFPYPNNEPVLTNSNTGFGWGTPFALDNGSDMRIPSTTNKDGLFVYTGQAQMFNKFLAPASRLGLFADDAAAAVLTTAGTRLLQEIIVDATFPGH